VVRRPERTRCHESRVRRQKTSHRMDLRGLQGFLKREGGRIVGNRFASIVLPEPGGPIIMILCAPPPRPRAPRFTFSCPFTSAKSTMYFWSCVKISFTSTTRGASRAWSAFRKFHRLLQRRHRVHSNSLHHRRFLPILSSEQQVPSRSAGALPWPSAMPHGWSQRAVQGQFTNKTKSERILRGHLFGGGKNADRHREVEC